MSRSSSISSSDLRRFLKAGLAFAVVGAALFVGASIYYEVRVRQRDNFFIHYSHFAKPSVRPRVLIVGDSRPAIDLKREVLPSTMHNFSHPGEGMRQFLLKIEYALATKPSIKYVVLQIDDYVLGEYRAFNARYGAYLSFADIGLIERFFPTSRPRIVRNVMAFAVPLLSHEERQIVRRVFLNDVAALLTGRSPKKNVRLDRCLDTVFSGEKSWQSLEPKKRTKQVERRALNQYDGKQVTEPLRRSLREIFAIARRHNVHVIGVRYPVAPEYNALNSKRNVDAVRRVMTALPFHTVLDFRRRYEDKPRLFNDPDHLNARGARIFSKSFVSAMKKIVTVDLSGPAACSGGSTMETVRVVAWPYRTRPWFVEQAAPKRAVGSASQRRATR